ncbi:MAG: hypothetical protein HOP08_20035 [Cyclobacteriaceae bacterium]|nr:hypothetical protein [Cyclobacteriaceae bacterium]
MKFLSIKEYFYKLNTIGFILLLMPLMVFIFLYYTLPENVPMVSDQEQEATLLLIVLVIFFIDLTTVHWLWSVKMKKIEKEIELAKRMDGYYSLTIMKMVMYCAGSLMMAFAFYLTSSMMFTAFFLAISIVIAFQWPSASAFCKHFRLHGREREMIMTGGDVVTKNKRR